MRSVLFALLASIALPSNVMADTEYQGSIPVDLVKLFLGTTPYGETKIFTDVLDAFPDFDIPSEFEVLGSIDRGYSQVVYFRTALSEQEALEELAESLSAANYSPFETFNLTEPEKGFVSAEAPPSRRSNRYCNDSTGYISSSYMTSEDMNTVSLSSSPHNDRTTCAAQLAEQLATTTQFARANSGLRQYLPRLELPERKTLRGYSPFFLGGGGSSGSRNGVEIKSSSVTDMTLEEVFTHFKSQIESQGWALDSENIGSATASGSWIKSPEPDLDLVGTLSVILAGEETYDLKFQLLGQGQRGGSSLGVFRSQ